MRRFLVLLALAAALPAWAQTDATAMFPQGTWTTQAYASVTLDRFGDDHGDFGLAHAGVGYYFQDDLSINLEAMGGGYDADDLAEDGYAFGLDLLLRWHALTFDEHRLSFYLEGGAGLIWTEDAFPAEATHQNFTPQAGIGLTWAPTHDLNIIAGTRWHHISNAAKEGIERNPGYDGVMVYAGLMLTF